MVIVARLLRLSSSQVILSLSRPRTYPTSRRLQGPSLATDFHRQTRRVTTLIHVLGRQSVTAHLTAHISSARLLQVCATGALVTRAGRCLLYIHFRSSRSSDQTDAQATMAEGTSSSGSLVLEKELTCSVCMRQHPAHIPVLILLPDLYRCHVPALDPARLPPYLLWFLLEGMVHMAGYRRCTGSPQDKPVYMPLMSCRGAWHAAECDCYDVVGHVPHFESKPRQEQR
jgi:hypothetical protein